MGFQLNKKRYFEIKEKEEKKKKKHEEEDKKKKLEDELKKRAQAQKNPDAASKEDTKPTTKVEPSVKEITPEEFERRKQKEREEKEMIEKLKNQPEPEVKNEIIMEEPKIEIKPEPKLEVKIDTNLDFDPRTYNGPHNPNFPYETPEKNKSLISPNHPCISTEWGVSQVKEIWTDEHGKTAIMPDKTHGGKMEKYFWGQPRVEENWITIPIDSSVRGKEVKINSDSNNLEVIIRGQTYIKREFFKKVNVSYSLIKFRHQPSCGSLTKIKKLESSSTSPSIN